MLLEMIKTAVGSNDGITAKKYFAGYIYDLSETLSNCFLEMGVAKEAKSATKPTGKGKAVEEFDIAKKQLQELANKDAAAQLSNKDNKKEDENKK